MSVYRRLKGHIEAKKKSETSCKNNQKYGALGEMKNILLTTIGLLLFVGCSDPEAEANKLYTQAAQLVREADAIEDKDFEEASRKREASIALVNIIPTKYPQSSLSVKISEGNFMISGQSIEEIKKKLAPNNLLLKSVEQENFKLAKEAVTKGANVNLKDKYGNTVLRLAASSSKDIVEMLLQNGAASDVNRIGYNKQPPLHIAVQFGSKEIAELLIANGADVNMISGYKMEAPLHIAAKKSKKEMAELLISNGANLDAFDGGTFGYTPLHWALNQGHEEVVELLITKGANVMAKSKAGFPLGVAAAVGPKRMVERLIDAGANVVNSKSDSGYNPLHDAASSGHVEIVEFLIAKGCDVNAKALDILNKEETPLDLALEYKHTETAALLRKHGGKTGEELKAEGK
jgi:ankyrin repeat protein